VTAVFSSIRGSMLTYSWSEPWKYVCWYTMILGMSQSRWLLERAVQRVRGIVGKKDCRQYYGIKLANTGRMGGNAVQLYTEECRGNRKTFASLQHDADEAGLKT